MADEKELKIVLSSDSSQAESSLKGFGDFLKNTLEITAGIDLANIQNQIIGLGKAAFESMVQFQDLMGNIQGNTSMSDKDMETLRQTVLKFGQESGASFDQLANGFMHITNEGFKAADAVTILHAAMEASIVTGGNASDVANSLATVMHNFGIEAKDAQSAMNTMLSIAAEGNMKLEDLATNFSLVSSVAHNFGVSLKDTGAAFDAITKQTADAAEAQTQLKELIVEIGAPTSQTKTEIEKLTGGVAQGAKTTKDYSFSISDASAKMKIAQDRLTQLQHAHKVNAVAVETEQNRIVELNHTHDELIQKSQKVKQVMGEAAKSGIDLAFDFSEAGLKAKGLHGVMEDVAKATHGNTDELKALFPNIRGFEGALSLTTTGAKDYTKSLQDAGKATGNDLLTSEYNHRLDDFTSKWKILKNTLQSLAIQFGSVVLPVATSIVNFITTSFIPGVENLTKKHADLFKQLDLLWQKFDKDFMPTIKLVVGFMAKEMLKTLNDTLDAFDMLFTGINRVWDKLSHPPDLGFLPKSINAINIPGNMVLHKASGGLASGLTLVGENGPELVNLPGGSNVYNNQQTQQMMGGTTIHINNPSVRSDNDIRAIVNQVKQALGRQSELARLGAI